MAKARQRGQIITKDRDRYLVRVYVGRGAGGKRQYSSRLVKGTKKDANTLLTAMLKEIDDQTFSGRSSMTLDAFLTRWLENKTDIAQSTKLDYTQRLANSVRPFLGGVKLRDLTPSHFEKLYADLTTKRGHSPRTVRYAHSIVHAALNTAVRLKLLAQNPTDAATESLPKKVRKEMQALSAGQVRDLFTATKGDTLYPLWVLLLTTGLRPSEALALQWGDINDGTLRVVRAMKKVGKNTYAEGSTKTDRVRTVTLTQQAQDALKAHRKATGALSGLVFHTRVGTPLLLTNVRRAWKVALEKAGLPTTTRLYDARHTHATLGIANGVHPKVMASRLGHSTVMLTLDTYSHVLPGMDEDAAATIDKALTTAEPPPSLQARLSGEALRKEGTSGQ